VLYNPVYKDVDVQGNSLVVTVNHDVYFLQSVSLCSSECCVFSVLLLHLFPVIIIIILFVFLF